MSSEMLQFYQYMKPDKMPYIIYADVESLIQKIDGCANNPENSSATKQVSISLMDTQCQQFWHLMIQKASILYIVQKIV